MTNFLKEKRIKSGLKAKKIASEIGVSRKTLYRIEERTSKLTIDKAKKLGKLYGICLEDIKSNYEVIK